MRLPTVWFVTDPNRTPDPVSIAERLPRGTGVIYRHFGLADVEATALRLAKIARARGLVLLIGADAVLAARVGAAGVHLPERAADRAKRLKGAHPRWLITTAAHSERAAHGALRAGSDAVLISAIFRSGSPSAGAPMGPRRLAQIVQRVRGPVFALGGVDTKTARGLVGTGVAGFAAVEGFTRP